MTSMDDSKGTSKKQKDITPPSNQCLLSLEALKLGNQLCFRLYAVSRNMTRLYAPLLESYGLTYPQYIILLALFEHHTMDFKELSQLVDLKTGTMTPIIQKLVELGYVSKVINSNDARRVNILLTQEGIALQNEIVVVPYALADLIKLSGTQYDTLTNQLDLLTQQLADAQQEIKLLRNKEK